MKQNMSTSILQVYDTLVDKDTTVYFVPHEDKLEINFGVSISLAKNATIDDVYIMRLSHPWCIDSFVKTEYFRLQELPKLSSIPATRSTLKVLVRRSTSDKIKLHELDFTQELILGKSMLDIAIPHNHSHLRYTKDARAILQPTNENYITIHLKNNQWISVYYDTIIEMQFKSVFCKLSFARKEAYVIAM